MSERDIDDEGRSLQEYVSLITQHQWALRRFILSLMPGSSEVDDVLQETNIVLWEKRKRFKRGSNFIAWATTIARFQVMRFRGMMKRSRSLSFSDEFVHELAEQLAPSDEERPLMMALDKCMEKIGERQRQLLTVRYTPGKSLKAYALEKGTSAEVLRVTLHRVRHALKRCIEDQLGGQTT